jgi:hypothetical protein
MTDRDFESVSDLWTIRNETQIRQFTRHLDRAELTSTICFLVDALRIEKKKTAPLTPPRQKGLTP